MCLKEPLISYQLEVEGGRLGYFFAGGGDLTGIPREQTGEQWL